tara:strand:- start:3890 stop:5410 length:1521 start_codon:yes stop_codon:yes gene_type:complete
MSLVPDLVKLNTIPVNYEQNIETDLIETSTFQEATNVATGFARFDLQQKGFLHSQSKLFLSLIPQTNARAYLPVNIGIGSVIDRAVLKVGNQVINEISDWNHLHMIKSAQVDNENNVEREQYTTGRTMNHKYLMRKVVGGVSGSTFPLSGSYGLDNHRNYSGSAGAAAGAAGGSEGFNGQIQPFAVMDATDVNTVRESPTYSVDLSDLFPFLATHSLPLYMIDQQLSIELYWSPLGALTAGGVAAVPSPRVCVPAGTADGAQYRIDRNELKFCADYIFYTDNDAMERYRNANPVIEFAFPDYRLSKTTLTQGQLLTGQVRNLGMANRLVSRVLTTVTNDAASSVSMIGKYNSVFPTRASATQNAGAVSYNLRYNDRFEFPINLTNPAQLFTHFTQSESIPFVTREEYSRQQQGLSGIYTFEGHRQDSGAAEFTGLSGLSFMLGTKLTGGRVGIRGIELHLTMGDAANGGMPDVGGQGAATPYTVRSYCEYMRIARLTDGGMTIFNA